MPRKARLVLVNTSPHVIRPGRHLCRLVVRPAGARAELSPRDKRKVVLEPDERVVCPLFLPVEVVTGLRRGRLSDDLAPRDDMRAHRAAAYGLDRAVRIQEHEARGFAFGDPKVV